MLADRISRTQNQIKSATSPFDLSLQLRCDRMGQTFVAKQYTAYPFRLSNSFRLDASDRDRAYLYLMNVSPGILANDQLRLLIELENNTQLYLTDQAATKVHCMPNEQSAQLNYHFKIAAGASLEFIPEPLILYKDSSLHQSTQITLDPQGQLFLSEIVVPGRIAHQENYQFRSYQNCLQITSPESKLLVRDAMRLDGKTNAFKHHALFSELPILATAIAVLPNCNLDQFAIEIERFPSNYLNLKTGHTKLPNCNGILIRAMSDNSSHLQTYIRYLANCARQMTNFSPLPEVPK